MNTSDCPYIVQFYGAIFKEVLKFTALIFLILIEMEIRIHYFVNLNCRVTVGFAWN